MSVSVCLCGSAPLCFAPSSPDAACGSSPLLLRMDDDDSSFFSPSFGMHNGFFTLLSLFLLFATIQVQIEFFLSKQRIMVVLRKGCR